MKYLLTTLLFLSASIGWAQSVDLPPVRLGQEALGGDVLLINMKEYLIISGKESRALERELGLEAKQRMTKDIVTSKGIGELIATYQPSNSRPTVRLILLRYAETLSQVNPKLGLN